MEPLVSVIMPVYNQEKYLADCIESVLNQTYRDFEFIILDDGSTDSSAEIIHKYAHKDKRIKDLYEKNAGRCIATNNLAQMAKGKLLAFLDADDNMYPQRLEKQVAFHLENPEVDGSSCHCQYINHKGDMLGKQHYPGLKTAGDSQKALTENKIIHCAITGLMTTKESFLKTGGLRSEHWYSEDLDFFNRFIEHGHSLVIIQQVLMQYRIHATAVTMQKPLGLLDKRDWTIHCTLLRRAGKPEITFEEFMAKRGLESWWKKINRKRDSYSNIFFRRAGVAMMSKDYVNFCWQLMAASMLSPAYVFRKLTNLTKAK
jgi:glycosyltransferase involved in cell wall biosynthesis